MRWSWLRMAVLLLLVAAIVAVALGPGLPSREEVRSLADGLGPWAAPTYLAAYAVACLLPVPKGAMSLAGGAIFGLLAGLPLVIVGAVGGATLTFALSRWLGRHQSRRLIEQRLPARLRSLDESLGRGGFFPLLVARLVPIVPFTAVNYALGLTSMRYRTFVVATALGILPNSTAYVVLAAYGAKPTSWPFALAAVVVLTLAGLAVWRQRHLRLRSLTPATP